MAEVSIDEPVFEEVARRIISGFSERGCATCATEVSIDDTEGVLRILSDQGCATCATEVSIDGAEGAFFDVDDAASQIFKEVARRRNQLQNLTVTGI